MERNEKDTARLKQLRTRRRKIQKQLRAIETRRKFLVGSAVAAMMAEDEQFRAEITALLSETLTRPADRALFGLDAKEEPVPAATPPDQAVPEPGDRDPAPLLARLPLAARTVADYLRKVLQQSPTT